MYRISLFITAGLLATLLSTAHAEPGCDDCQPSLAPRLWIPDGDPTLDQLPLKASQAEVRINAPIAQVTVTQRYRNAGTRPINARYVFPGSTRAAVHGLTMKIGERLVKAKTKQIFEQAKTAGKRVALLEQQILTGLLTYSQDDENYILAIAQPPARVQAGQIMRREYLFILDVSGSMPGFPLDTAKSLMQQLLTVLKPHESFNILFFSGGSNILSPTPLPATPANVRQALATMQNYQGGGATELIAALESAYSMPHDADTARSIVVVTDGYVGVEREAYDLIGKNLHNTNLFAFGIGSAVNRYLIESMAKAGAGEPFVVTEQNQVTEVGNRFRRYVEAPLLSNIRLQGEGVELYDQEPADIPVMLAERPVVVFGKFRNAGESASLVLSGTAANSDYRVEMPLSDARHDNRAELLPVLWARHRLMRLSDWAGGEVEANRSAIVELGLKYSLLSRYTSFVAVDEPVANTTGSAKNLQQPLPLPLGIETTALAPRAMPEPDLSLLLTLLATALVMAIKQFYSVATAAQLQWQLYPLVLALELCSDLHFQATDDFAWRDALHGVDIVKSCAGINFLLISLLGYLWLWRDKPSGLRLTVRALLCAWFTGCQHLAHFVEYRLPSQSGRLRRPFGRRKPSRHRRCGLLCLSLAAVKRVSFA